MEEVRIKEHFPLGSLTLALHTFIIDKKRPLLRGLVTLIKLTHSARISTLHRIQCEHP